VPFKLSSVLPPTIKIHGPTLNEEWYEIPIFGTLTYNSCSS
jgi:hypothetical protein